MYVLLPGPGRGGVGPGEGEAGRAAGRSPLLGLSSGLGSGRSVARDGIYVSEAESKLEVLPLYVNQVKTGSHPISANVKGDPAG